LGHCENSAQHHSGVRIYGCFGSVSGRRHQVCTGISGIAEVMTAVRENIPVIAVVANNFEWGADTFDGTAGFTLHFGLLFIIMTTTVKQ
jgi:hypothetical protein